MSVDRDDLPDMVVRRARYVESQRYHKNGGTGEDPRPACGRMDSSEKFLLRERRKIEPQYIPCKVCFDPGVMKRAGEKSGAASRTAQLLSEMDPADVPP